MSKIETKNHQAEQLHEFSVSVFQSFGVPESDAKTAADVLIVADLRGIDSHGIARLTAYHCMLAAGRINPKPKQNWAPNFPLPSERSNGE